MYLFIYYSNISYNVQFLYFYIILELYVYCPHKYLTV